MKGTQKIWLSFKKTVNFSPVKKQKRLFMRLTPISKLTSLLVLFLSLFHLTFAQSRVVSGRVTDQNGAGLPGVTVTVKGTSTSTQTASDGTYSISAPESGILVFTSIGFASIEADINKRTVIDASLSPTASNLSEVVVIGYGTVRRREQTGAMATVTAKDFNKGIVASPDQLIQGIVAGLDVTSNTGQPGSATTVKIRGNNSIRGGTDPLYVIDGIPLDGRNARPGNNAAGIGNTPDANPLIYINPADIASIDVLKDASASAIYGSRGANGVILITTKKGQPGLTKMEASASVGVSGLMKNADILSASQYRQALQTYGAKSDSGQTLDPFKSIIRNAVTQNYTFALSGGNETGRFRASFLASDQQGIILKTALEKYVANINGQYRFFDKKLSFDFNITAAHTKENIAPISTDAGSTGNLISAAMNWNPTLYLVQNGIYNSTNPSGQINPLALSAAYDDIANVTTLLGSFTAGYKITPDLEYKLLYGVNYGIGTREAQMAGWITGAGDVNGKGAAAVAQTQLFSQTITHTLNYTKQITSSFNLNALAGYEYWTTAYSGNQLSVEGFDYNLTQTNKIPLNYYDNLQDGNPNRLTTFSYNDPSVSLQSYFARAILDFQDKYILTASFRADGSSRFGSNNKYAYFPAVAAAWNLTSEGFMKGNTLFNSLRLRLGYGQTGNQEFPAGSAQQVGQYQVYGNGTGALVTTHFANPNLKWETVTSTDGGVDFALLHNRLYGYVDFFSKKTTDPLFLGTLPTPSSGASIWSNLPGYITNKGFEVSLGALIVDTKDFTWNLRVNMEYVRNKFVYPASGNSPLFLTGAINGQGVSNTFSEAIANNQPIDVFYLRTFSGFDKNGIAITTTSSSYVGDPNPHVIAGFSTDFNYKKLSLIINAHGAFGNKIFNNTLTSVTNVGNITNGKNIAASQLGSGEGLSNPVSASTRFLQSGNYMKLGNASIRYSVGNIGRSIKNVSVFVTGSNLFEITKYTGFDAEVNTANNNNGVPSLGVDYIGYPTERTFLFGINFSL